MSHRVLHSLSLIALACAAAPANADLAASVPNSDKPDFALVSVAFKGKSGNKHDFPISSNAAAEATLRLNAAEPAGMQGDSCKYEMTFEAVNAGPGWYYAPSPSSGVTVGVDVKFPDGTDQSFKGAWFCAGAYDPYGNAMGGYTPGTDPATYTLLPGKGCATVEPVILAVGRTRMTWTFDPDSQVAEYTEANNKFTVDLVVGPNCSPSKISVRPAPSDSPMQVPEGAFETKQPSISAEALRAASGASRDSLAKAFRFGGNGKMIQRPGARTSPRNRNP